MSTAIDHDLERIFWTPVVVADLPDHPEICATLEPAIFAQHEAMGGRPPQESSWQSRTDLLEWGGSAVAAIRDHAISLAGEHTIELFPGRSWHWRCEGWANICGHGHYNRPHFHPGAYWTAVYYVRIDPGDGGELVLHDPRMPAIEMHAPHLRIHPSGGEGAINLKPEAGMLLLFPAWLTHSIAPFFGDGYRISVAINLSVEFD